MSKSPEEYFSEQQFAPTPTQGGASFTEAELAFMRKYMGLDPEATLNKLGIATPVAASPAVPVPSQLTETIVPSVPVVADEPVAAAPVAAAPVAAAPVAAAPVADEPVAAAPVLQDEPELDLEPEPPVAEVLETLAKALVKNLAKSTPEVTIEPAATVEPVADVPLTSDTIEPVVAPPVEAIFEPVATVEPAADVIEPVSALPAADVIEPAVAADSGDLEAFKETVAQQFIGIQSALEALKTNGTDTSLIDALFRSLSTVQNSASYLGLDEVKLYAERTVGIVDQGRKSSIDFAILVSLLEQESGIIEDMIASAVLKLETAPAAENALTGANLVVAEPTLAAPVVAVAPVSASEVAPAAPVAPVVIPTPVPTATAMAAPTSAPVATTAAPAASTESAPVATTAAPAASTESAPVHSPAEDRHHEVEVEEDLDLILRRENELQMVGFYLGKQEFTVPTLAVQEVIRYETPAKMPAAPAFVAGVINLRGKMTPLVHLRDMLEIRQERQTEDRFIIVCRRKGLQLGLIIERVHTMYRVPQTDIDWGIEAHLGINVDFISGLLKLNDSLVGVVSVDRIIDHVLD